MDTTFIIISVVILLIGGVAFSGYFQFREQQKAEKRQKVAKLRFRAREGQELHDAFFEEPIGPNARKVILQYVERNIRAALQVDPNQQDLRQSLEMLAQKINSPEVPADSQKMNYSGEPQELMNRLNRIRKLMKFIHRIGKVPGIDMSTASQALAYLKQLYLNMQIRTFMIAGQQKQAEKNALHAMQYYDNAKKLLLRQNIAKPETQELLKELERLESEIKNEVKAPSFDDLEQLDEEDSSIDLGDSNDLFQPKKKW